MTVGKVVAFRGIQDCKIAKITTDTESEITYGSVIDVPIQNLSFTENVEEYTLKHDDEEQAFDSKVLSYDISGTMARVPLDVLEVISGGDVTDMSTYQLYEETSSSSPSYFKLEIQSTRVFGSDNPVADAHIIFPKCKKSSLDWSIDEGFANISFSAKAIYTTNGNKVKQVRFNETKTAIS